MRRTGTGATRGVRFFTEREVVGLLTLVPGERVSAMETDAESPPGPGRWQGARQPAALRFMGRYLLWGTLASTAAGTVFAAYDLEERKHVALKYYFRGFLTAAMRRAFARETKLLERLSHPGIVRQYESGETEEGDLFQVLEWAQRGDLGTWLEQNTDPSWYERMAALLPVAEGLAEVHKRGIVHGDIKPSNILLMADDRACLADWGSAYEKNGNPGSAMDPCRGTFAYLGRGLKLGKPPTPADDVHAFTVTLCQVLTGKEAGGGGRPQLKTAPSWPAPVHDLEKRWPSQLRDRIAAAMESEGPGGFPDAGRLARAMIDAVQRRNDRGVHSGDLPA